MGFGLSTISKFDYARRAAACLARLLLHQRDAVGAVVLAEQKSLYVPPRQKAAHLRASLTTIQSHNPAAAVVLVRNF